LNSGNIPVARKSGDNQKLMKPTFEVLALGETVAVFPEGTSYTEPRIMQVKDGIAWTALEYTKWLRGDEGRKSGGKDVVVVPVSIVYTNKSKYRSSVVVE
jgi:glycerol-3-phosphate O-acyltransferase/dihydroxyacetone phosphate acyltransferase